MTGYWDALPATRRCPARILHRSGAPARPFMIPSLPWSFRARHHAPRKECRMPGGRCNWLLQEPVIDRLVPLDHPIHREMLFHPTAAGGAIDRIEPPDRLHRATDIVHDEAGLAVHDQ